MELVLDLGNTHTKLAVFNNSEIVHHQIIEGTLEHLPADVFQNYTLESALLSSVVHHSPSLEHDLSSRLQLIHFDTTTPLPIQNSYATPTTLGQDRLANAVAMFAQQPNTPCLCIDAGTCLKFDFINADGIYLGGAISLGLHMRYLALHTFTDKLPLLGGPTSTPLIGNSTETSIRSGVANGMLQEIKGTVERYRSKHPNLQVFLTGGDAEALGTSYMSGKNSIFADNFLTLRGLHAILLHQIR